MKTPALNRPMSDRPDGKSYVEAVNAAGQRSRTLIYFILILTVLTFAAVRNSYQPDWIGERYQTREAVFACFVRGECKDFDDRLVRAGLMKEDAGGDERQTALKRASKALDIDFDRLRAAKPTADPAPTCSVCTPPDTEPNYWKRRELALIIETLVKRDTDNDTIALPLLGSAIDINDLWLVSGGVMFFLLYFLRASQKQEERNIRYIHNTVHEFDNLVAMHQVLSPHALEIGSFGKILEWLFGLMPTFLYLYLAILDVCSLDISYLYIGPTRTYIETGIEILVWLVVAYNNCWCIANQQTIRNLIKPAHASVSRIGGIVTGE